jgi:hypothetical protein
MKFVALGSIAEGGEFKVGNELFIFFVKAVPGKEKGMKGTMWIYDNAYVHVLREEVEPRAVRGEVELTVA